MVIKDYFQRSFGRSREKVPIAGGCKAWMSRPPALAAKTFPLSSPREVHRQPAALRFRRHPAHRRGGIRRTPRADIYVRQPDGSTAVQAEPPSSPSSGAPARRTARRRPRFQPPRPHVPDWLSYQDAPVLISARPPGDFFALNDPVAAIPHVLRPHPVQGHGFRGPASPADRPRNLR